MSIDNKILMLSLISISSKEGWLGITKLQKLSFLVEYLLSQNDQRASDYEFFMYDLGPISLEVYNDFEFLMNEELVVENEDGIRLGELGESMVEQFRGTIPKEISSAIQRIVFEYASMKTSKLVNTVHKMKIKLPDGTITRVEDIPKNLTVLPKPVKTIFRLGAEYLETFHIMSDRSLIKAIRQARRKGAKSREYEPLVSP